VWSKLSSLWEIGSTVCLSFCTCFFWVMNWFFSCYGLHLFSSFAVFRDNVWSYPTWRTTPTWFKTCCELMPKECTRHIIRIRFERSHPRVHQCLCRWTPDMLHKDYQEDVPDVKDCHWEILWSWGSWIRKCLATSDHSVAVEVSTLYIVSVEIG